MEVDSPGRGFAAPADAPTSAEFAAADGSNVEGCAKFLMNSLSALGMSDQLNLLSSQRQDVAQVCNCMFQLIQQRQADKETQQKLEELATKLRTDAQASANERTRLEGQLQDKFTELGSLEIKLRTMQAKHRADAEAWARQADAAALRAKQGERREAQLEARLKQQAAEMDALRAKLRNGLVSKGGRGGAAEDGGGLAALSATAPAGFAGQRAASAGARGGGADSQKLQKLLDASEAKAAAAEADSARLREQLLQMRAEFGQLLARCEALGVGVAASEQASMAPGAHARTAGARGGRGAARSSSVRSSAARNAVAAEAMSSEELGAYLSTDLKVVQARCRSLLDGAANGRRAAGPDTAAQQQQQLEDAHAVLLEQDKALSRALVALYRAEAQRTAAQQRASAAQLRTVALEKRLSAATAEQVAGSERALGAAARAHELEDQVARLTQQLAEREEELQRAAAQQQQQQQSLSPMHGKGKTLACLHTDLAAAERRAAEAQRAAAAHAGQTQALERELEVVRKQLALMTEAVAMTRRDGSSALTSPAVSAAPLLASAHAGAAAAGLGGEGSSEGAALPQAHARMGQRVAQLSALLLDDEGEGGAASEGEGEVQGPPARPAAQAWTIPAAAADGGAAAHAAHAAGSGSSAAAAGGRAGRAAVYEAGGAADRGVSSDRRRQRWDMSPIVACSPRQQLLGEAGGAAVGASPASSGTDSQGTTASSHNASSHDNHGSASASHSVSHSVGGWGGRRAEPAASVSASVSASWAAKGGGGGGSDSDTASSAAAHPRGRGGGCPRPQRSSSNSGTSSYRAQQAATTPQSGAAAADGEASSRAPPHAPTAATAAPRSEPSPLHSTGSPSSQATLGSFITAMTPAPAVDGGGARRGAGSGGIGSGGRPKVPSGQAADAWFSFA